MPVELGHLEQQVAAGDLGTAADAQPAQRGAEAVEGVEAAGQHQPLGDRAGHLRAVPEVGQRVVGPGGDDPLDLTGVDALDLRQGQPDPPGPAVGPAPVARVGAGGLAEHDRRRLVERRHPLDDVVPSARR